VKDIVKLTNEHLKRNMPDPEFGDAATAALKVLGIDTNKDFGLWLKVRKAIYDLVKKKNIT
jgi:hypothetical protein